MMHLKKRGKQKRGISKRLSWGKQLCLASIMALVIPLGSALAATNTGLSGDDRQAGPFPIGFNFQYYGQDFSQFYATTNGLLQFQNPTTSYSNTSLPSSYNNTLFVFWDDLRTDVSGQTPGVIQYELQGDEPNRRLVVQWTNQYFFGSNLPMGTFQVVLFEGSNEVKYQYRDLLDERSFGNSATVGVQGPNREVVQIGFNEANLVMPEQAISFIPAADGSSYEVSTDAEFNFFDISGLSPNRPWPAARYVNNSLQWFWEKVPSLNTYEVKVLNQAGEAVYNQVLGDVDTFSYTQGLQHGQTYRSRVRGSINQGGTWEAWSSPSTPITVDQVKPTASLSAFAHTGANSARVTYSANDDLSGIARVELQIATDSAFHNLVFNGEVPVSGSSYSVSNLPDSTNLYARLNVVDSAGNTSGYTPVKSIGLSTPVIVSPVNNSTIRQPEINVSGTAGAGDEVQMYLNNVATGVPVKADASGKFNMMITLSAQGSYTLTAKAKNDQGTSDQSSAVNFTYEATAPTAVFTVPAEGATLTGVTEITVNAMDEVGVKRVEIFADNTRLAAFNQAPYQVSWDVSTVENGEHTLKVVVTSNSGKTASQTRIVNVQVESSATETPQTTYTGELQSISPEVSYGVQPVHITGKAVDRSNGQLISNTPLQVVLNVKGFERRINVVSDANGIFNYTFVPQANDSGTYDIAIVHPKEETAQTQGSFTINRVRFNIGKYALTAARNIPVQITVHATASSGAQGLRWVVRDTDQPGGALPQGISIDAGSPINMAAGANAPMVINFTANDQAAATGTVVLTAFAQDSGELVRGTLEVNYKLVQAAPALFATSSYIETGVQQGSSVTEAVTIENRGLVAAQNVHARLLSNDGSEAPAWVFLGSIANIGAVKEGESIELQVTAQPDAAVAEGIYQFKLRISADNDAGGDIPVTVSVTQSGIGAVRFSVADIYTQTMGDDGQPIQGVNGVNIKLQNENVLTEQYTLTTDTSGMAYAADLPTGIYLFRASATNHMDASGRVRIRPGITTSQSIFLDYELVSIEFDVTETTVNDIYDIEVDATFNTQVPAPVVLLEPMSINLAGMQVGEERTGQLTLTNYGLIDAQNVVFHAPDSDREFSYEFLADIPEILPPKTRIVIPYRVVALSGENPAIQQTEPRTRVAPIALPAAPSLGRAFSPTSRKGDKQDCTSYSQKYFVGFGYECINGEWRQSDAKGQFYYLKGTTCSGSSVGAGGGGTGGGSGGGFGSGSGFTPAPTAMSPGCVPTDNGQCGAPYGERSANQ